MTKKLIILLIPLFLLACSKKGAEKSDVSIKIISSATSNLSTNEPGLVGTFGNPTPTVIDGYNCFGVLVSYSDTSAPGVCRDINDLVVSSPDKAFGFANLGTELSGEIRISDKVKFEAFGLYSASGNCPTSGTELASMKADISAPVILGKTVQSVTSDTSSIAITASVDGNHRILKSCSSTKMAFRPPKVCDPNENPSASSTTGFAAGSGTTTDPYIICNEDQLRLIDTTTPGVLSQHYELGADISLTSAWTPIATNSGNYFTGSFNGKGRIISGVTISTAGSNGTGFFGNVGAGATISNLKLHSINYSINNTGRIGGVAGFMSGGSITNTSVTGVINGRASLGGIVGYARAGLIQRTRNKASVLPSVSSGFTPSYFGGIVGKFQQGSTGSLNIQSVANEGVISNGSTGDFAGGIVGKGSGKHTIINSLNRGNIDARNYVGGIAGKSTSYDGSSFNNLFNSGVIKAKFPAANAMFTGGLMGYLQAPFSGSMNFKNNFNVGPVWGLASATATYLGQVTGKFYDPSLITAQSNNFFYPNSNGQPSAGYESAILNTTSSGYNCNGSTNYNINCNKRLPGDFKGTAVETTMGSAWQWGSIWQSQTSDYPTLINLP